MTIKRKFIPLFILTLTIGYFATAAFFILGSGDPDFAPIIKGDTASDLFILFIIIPLLICLPAILLKFIALINFKFNKLLQKREYEYHYADLGERPFTAINIIFRAMLPVFMSLAISLLVVDLFLLSEMLWMDEVNLIIVLSLILAPIVIFLIVPIWTFKDSGILKVRKKPKKRIPPEIVFFGKTQHQYYKGFTGITTPILYVITITKRIGLHFAVDVFLILLFPVFLIGFFMPLLLIYESRIEKVREKLIKSLKLTPISLDKIDLDNL
jgi:hypothetical protein